MKKGKGNEWDLEGGEVSPQDPVQKLMDSPVYKSGQDKYGHEVFLGAKFPKGVGSWVEAIKERQSSPYPSRADVVRDALYLGLRILNLRYGMDPRWLNEEKLARIRKGVEDEILFSMQDTRMAENLEELCREDREKAKKALEEYLGDLDPSPLRAKAFRRKLAAYSLENLLEGA